MQQMFKNCIIYLSVCTLFLAGIFGFVLCSSLFTLALVEAWLFILEKAFSFSLGSFMEFGQKGFYAFALSLAVFINSYVNIDYVQIKYSRFYLSCFKNPEQGVQIWLNLRFYSGAFAGILFIAFSLYSIFNLCLADLKFLVVDIDPDLYIDASLYEIQYKLAGLLGKTAVLIGLSRVSSWLLGKYRALVFFQALLLVVVSGIALLANSVLDLQFTMLELINFLLIANIFSDLMCGLYHFIKFAPYYGLPRLQGENLNSSLILRKILKNRGSS